MPPKRKKSGSKAGETDTKSYRHTESESLLRPDVGTQAQFRKKKPPVTYRYDSSLSPSLEWDGQNHAREIGEWLIEVMGRGSTQWRGNRKKFPRGLMRRRSKPLFTENQGKERIEISIQCATSAEK